MADILYKVYYNNELATVDQMVRIEEVIVEQEENMAWEARIKIPMCADEHGQWSEGDEDLISTLERIRIEIKVAENSFIPLIDGPVVGYDSFGSSEPGQSAVTFIVHDDSVFLNQEERVEIFEDRPDHDVVEELLNRPEQITNVDVDSVPEPDSSVGYSSIQRGTEMDLLQQLARQNNMYVAVLPGVVPGKSKGVFKSFPTQTSTLPPLVLLGSDRNVDTMEMSNENTRPTRVTAATLRIGDKTVIERVSSFRNVTLLGEEYAFREENESESAHHILPPRQGETVDLQNRVNAESERSTYSFDASGNVSACYKGVLTPYQVIKVQAVKGMLTGNYRISQVTHTLTPSTYSQSFQLKRNAVTAPQNNESINLIESIF